MEDLTAAAGKAWAELRFNPFHAPAGPGGGEFTSSGGAGKGGGGSAPVKAQGPQHTPETPAELHHIAQLHAKARADREQAHKLEAQLKQVEQQIHASRQATAKAAAAAKKSGLHGGKKAAKHHKGPQHHAKHHLAAHKKTASLQQQAGHLRTEIKTLLGEADSLDRQAKAL
jgi:hypothetical protein